VREQTFLDYSKIEQKLSPFALAIYWVLAFQVLFFCYQPSLQGPFLYDDLGGIVANEDLRHPTELSRFVGNHDSSLEFDRRPITGFLTALNFQWAELSPGKYRIFNLLLHFVNALLLAEFIRRVALKFAFEAPKTLAVSVSTLWLLHPLSTSTVSYIYQRSEMLMATFYLIALVSFLRGTDQGGRRYWLVVCFLSSICAALSKEVGLTIVAPLLLLDWLVVCGTVGKTIKNRWAFHLGLLLVTVSLSLWIASGVRMTELAMGEDLATPWGYFKYQAGVLLSYFGQVIWPHPLIFASEHESVPNWAQWLPRFLVLLTSVGGLLLVGRKRRWIWLALGIALSILAPTSSFIPIPLEPKAEFRMYLPLGIILALLVAGLMGILREKRSFWIVAAFPAILLSCALATRIRNDDYGSARSLWRSVVIHQPRNINGLSDLGLSSLSEGEFSEASECANKLMILGQEDPVALSKGWHLTGLVALEAGESKKALEIFKTFKERGFRVKSLDLDMALALARCSRLQEAQRHLDTARKEYTEVDLDMLSASAELDVYAGRREEAHAKIETLTTLAPSARRVRFLESLVQQRFNDEQ